MLKQDIENYLLERYKSKVSYWQQEKDITIKAKDFSELLTFEGILQDCFNYNAKVGCHTFALYKKGKLVLDYTF